MFMDDQLTASRLVNELMLVSVLVGGTGAEAFAAALTEAGAAAEALAGPDPDPGYDLAVLLGAPDPDSAPEMLGLVQSLTQASERLLLVPLSAAGDDHAPALPGLTRWFEIFAELGYQPVVDFDAGFVAAGAFLVDRGATAAESELAAFADRLQNSPATAPPATQPPPDRAVQAELDALRERLPQLEAQVDQLTYEAAHAEGRNTGWDGLRGWVNAAVRDPARDSLAALRHDLPILNILRGPEAPPIVPSLPRRPTAGGWLSRWFRPSAAAAPGPTPVELEETALVRASRYFDPAWYIASTPELCAGECIDPVFHYVFVGALRHADPGPWFDTQAYLAAHPEAAGSGLSALAHALRSRALEVQNEVAV
jgi:hypothetical protein